MAIFERGTFSEGPTEGWGVITMADGLKYEGEFVSNMPMGQGTYTWPDGSSYKGQVCSGLRHGTGTHTCAKKVVTYKGQWDQGSKHGKGVIYYNQDKTSLYKGDWVKNSREGMGVRCYPSGNLYSGEWKNNLRHGRGSMKWLNLGQQYVGMWRDGVQHGQGTHIWFPRHADGSRYSLINRYTGNFNQGQKHGLGTFCYASGVIYEGEWSNDKRHAKGKFIFKDGSVFEGDLTDDQMMAYCLRGSTAPIVPLDMALNMTYLLNIMCKRKLGAELKEVGFAFLTHGTELRSIYSFYSRLGLAPSPGNICLLTRLQLWRLLKDCNVHHRITLTQIDHLIREDNTTEEIHSPFTPILLSRLLSSLVVVAYHMYHKDIVSQMNPVAACFSKLMTDNILPNAKKVKGFLFRQPDCALVAVNYLNKCWEIYQAFCKVNAAPRDDGTMTYRDLLFMFKNLHLLDRNLTTAGLLKIINAETHDPNNLSSCLDLEITFLEFFEVLLGSAEVKCQQVPEGFEQDQLLPSPDNGATGDVEANRSKEILQTENAGGKKSSIAWDAETQQEVKTEATVESQSEVQTAEHIDERKDLQTRRMENKGHDLELWTKASHQFFNHFLFPSSEQYQLKSKKMKEEEHDLAAGSPKKE